MATTTDRRERSSPTKPPRRDRARRSPVARVGRIVALAGLVVGLVATVTIAVLRHQTERDIADHRDRVVEVAKTARTDAVDAAGIAALPEVVQRWVAYTFDDPTAEAPQWVRVEFEGQFRRPLTTSFDPMTARQVSAVAEPAFVFSGTTSMLPGVWARAYDAYVDGEMEMRAKIQSALTVVDETSTPELDQTSLQRWLLEAPLHPWALLPGGPVTWEPVDDRRARAVVAFDGVEAALVATFGRDGRLERFDAEHDGDLTTPYHGSGEHVTRSGDRTVDGVRIPHTFTIARAADGALHPFWRGTVTHIGFHDGPEA